MFFFYFLLTFLTVFQLHSSSNSAPESTTPQVITSDAAPSQATVVPLPPAPAPTISSPASAPIQKPNDYVIILADNGKIIIADPPTYKLINQNKMQGSYDQIKSASGSTLPMATSMTNAIAEIDSKSFVRLTFMTKAVAIMQLTLNKTTKEYKIVTAATFVAATVDPKFVQLISHYAPAAPANLAKMSNNQKVTGSLEAPAPKPAAPKPTASTSTAKAIASAAASTAVATLQKATGISAEAFLQSISPNTKDLYLVLKNGSVFFDADKSISTDPKGAIEKVGLELTKMISSNQRTFLTPNINIAKQALDIMKKESVVYLYENGKKIGTAQITPDDVIQKIVCPDATSKAKVVGQFGTALKKLFNIQDQTALLNLIKSK